MINLKNRYMMLGRLQQDCEYYLGHGNRSKKVLYYLDETEHIDKMKKLYNTLSEKPEWLTYEKILQYDKLMVMGLQNSTGNLGYKDKWYSELITSDKKLIYDELFTRLPWLSDLTVHSFRDDTGYYREYTHNLTESKITKDFKTSFVEYLSSLNVVVDEDEYYIFAHYIHKSMFIKILFEEQLGIIRISGYYES